MATTSMSEGTDSSSTGTTPTTTSSTGSTSDTATTTTGTTTGEPLAPGNARIFYTVNSDGSMLARALRLVELTDGVAAAPVTVLEAPEGETFRHTLGISASQRWFVAEGTNTGRLWVVDTAAAVATPVSLPPGLSIGGTAFSPDETLLTFTAAGMDGRFERYLCLLEDGGGCAPEVISPPLQGMATYSGPAVISPNNTWIVYRGDQDGDDDLDVMLTALDAPGQATVLASFPDWHSFPAANLRFTADESVLYVGADVEPVFDIEHFAIDLTTDPPSSPISLHTPTQGDARVDFAPDLSAMLLWTGTAEYGNLWRIPLVGLVAGAPVLVNPDGPGRTYTWDILWTHDSKRVVFLADHAMPGVNELYVAAAGEPLVKLNSPLSPTGAVDLPFLTPSPTVLLYAAEVDQDSGRNLYWTDLETPGEVLAITDGGGFNDIHDWAADGSAMLFTQKRDGSMGLYLLRVGDAPAVPVQLDTVLPLEDHIFAHARFSSDGARVFYRTKKADDEIALVTLAVDADGPIGAPLELSAPGEHVMFAHVLPPT